MGPNIGISSISKKSTMPIDKGVSGPTIVIHFLLLANSANFLISVGDMLIFSDVPPFPLA